MFAKFQILGIFMCLPLLGIFAQQSETQLNYINRFKDIAVQEMERTGIPASIKLAQGLLESAAGQSVLARRANNHFGIKCGANWKGDTIYREDDDYDANGRLIKSCFRAYRNSDASYVAHSEFLRDPRKAFRYGFLFRLDPYDYRAWANGLKQAGYATSPTYPQSLITLIERYELYRYDQPSTTIDPPAGVVVGGNNNGTTIPGTISAGGILDNNDVRYVVAAEGERLEDIARRVDVSVRNLIDYNEKMRSAQQTVGEGERVYLQPKRNAYRGRTKFHTVEAGQSMFDISQEYAVKLSKLYKRNRMESGQEPAAGEKIKLRGWSKVKETPRLRNGDEVDFTPPAPNAPEGELEMIEPDEEDTRPEPVRPVPPPPPPVRPEQPSPGGSNPDVPIIIVDPDGQQAPPPAPAPNRPNTNTGTPPPPPPPPPPPVITPTPDPAPPATGAPVYHTVVSGETLYGISRRYNITVDELKQLNGLTTNNIQVGSKLRVK